MVNLLALRRGLATLAPKPSSKKTTQRVWQRPGTTRYRDPSLKSFNEREIESRGATRATARAASAGPTLVARKAVSHSADHAAPFWRATAAAEPVYQHGLHADEVRAVLGDAAEAARLHGPAPREALQRELLERVLGAATMNNAELLRVQIARAVQHFQQKGILDTGSPEVQAAVMSIRIRNLEEHVMGNRRDTHNRVKLQHFRDARRKMLEYLRRASLARYQWTVNQLGLPANI